MAQSQSPPAFPDLLWRLRHFLSAVSFAVDTCRRSNGTVNRCLFNFLDFKSSPLTKPFKNVKSSDVTVDPSRNLWFRLYTPTSSAAAASLPFIVFYHGGGFSFMAPNSKSYDDFCQRLAREIPAVVVSVNYRLAPEHRYPSQYDDGFDVLKFIDDGQSDIFGGAANLKQCFLAGDSAGGNIAHHVALRASEHEFPSDDCICWRIGPVARLAKEVLRGIEEVGERSLFGDMHPNAIHTFYGYPELEESAKFIEQVRDFVQMQLVKQGSSSLH